MRWMVELKAMGDDALIEALGRAVERSRHADAELVAHLAEVDRRRLYLGRGCSSMFGYCTDVLHMSEGAAYARIAAARAARRHPVLIEMLADGRLHVSGIARLAPHLTEVNRDDLLARAAHRSKRHIEAMVAELAPKPDVPAAIRKLPAQRPTPPAATPPTIVRAPTIATAPVAARRPQLEVLAPARYKVQFTASAELEAKLERLANEMRHQVPDGDLAALIELAVDDKLAAIERRRYARAQSPRQELSTADTSPTSRHIPAAVRRAVRQRDGDQCTFQTDDGRRCPERGALEFHHEQPFARGGTHELANVRLLCRAHNQHLAERDFGLAHIESSRARESRPAYRAA